jgi:hypothetical protein
VGRKAPGNAVCPAAYASRLTKPNARSSVDSSKALDRRAQKRSVCVEESLAGSATANGNVDLRPALGAVARVGRLLIISIDAPIDPAALEIDSQEGSRGGL